MSSAVRYGNSSSNSASDVAAGFVHPHNDLLLPVWHAGALTLTLAGLAVSLRLARTRRVGVWAAGLAAVTAPGLLSDHFVGLYFAVPAAAGMAAWWRAGHVSGRRLLVWLVAVAGGGLAGLLALRAFQGSADPIGNYWQPPDLSRLAERVGLLGQVVGSELRGGNVLLVGAAGWYARCGVAGVRALVRPTPPAAVGFVGLVSVVTLGVVPRPRADPRPRQLRRRQALHPAEPGRGGGPAGAAGGRGGPGGGPARFQFVLVGDRPDRNGALPEATVVAALGEPAERVPVGERVLLVYDRPGDWRLARFGECDGRTASRAYEQDGSAVTYPGAALLTPPGVRVTDTPGLDRVADDTRTAAGVVAHGPYVVVGRPGQHRATFRLTAAGDTGVVGYVDVVWVRADGTHGKILASAEVRSAAGGQGLPLDFHLERYRAGGLLEFRLSFAGRGRVALHGVRFERRSHRGG